jgi:hypothetical protein
MNESPVESRPSMSFEDRQPDWLNVVLGWGKRRKKSSDLHVTISLSEHYISTRAGNVRFGLNGGQLDVRLDNAVMPLDAREPKDTLPIKLTITRKISESAGLTRTSGSDSTVSLGIKQGKPEAALTKAKKKALERNNLAATEAGFSEDEWLVRPMGSQSRPRWKFKPGPGRRVLEGSYHRMRLGRVYPTARRARVEARFTALPEQVDLLEVTGLASIPLEKLRLFRIVMARRWLGDYLSRVTLDYETEEGLNGPD